MQFDGHLSVCLLDLVLRRFGCHTENLVIGRFLGVLISSRSPVADACSRPVRVAISVVTCRLWLPGKHVLATATSNTKLTFVRMWPFEVQLGSAAWAHCRRSPQPRVDYGRSRHTEARPPVNLGEHYSFPQIPRICSRSNLDDCCLCRWDHLPGLSDKITAARTSTDAMRVSSSTIGWQFPRKQNVGRK